MKGMKVNMHDAKTHLSRYVAELKEGESLVLCRRNVPVAEIRPLPTEARRPAAPGRWSFEVPGSFFEPLPEEVLTGFGEPGADS